MPHKSRFHVHFHSHRHSHSHKPSICSPTTPTSRKASKSSVSSAITSEHTPPTPVLTLYIPSCHDSAPLECRIFHPTTFPSSLHARKCAVVAHPYAPLGGNQDDPVVVKLLEVLLDKGWVVGTFNFRGAGKSKGKTSWTGQAEVGDYATIAGFVLAYTSALEPVPMLGTDLKEEEAMKRDGKRKLVFLNAGYSYGSMISSHSRPIPIISKELRGYGVRTAEEWATGANRRSLAIVRGRKAWVGSSVTVDKIGVDAVPPTPSFDPSDGDDKRGERPWEEETETEEEELEHEHERDCEDDGEGYGIKITSCYLVVSPLMQPVASVLALPSLFYSFPRCSVKGHQTLGVYGTNDLFSGIGKLRKWSAKREAEAVVDGKGGYEGVEVEGGDHFWREAGGVERLGEIVVGWLGNVDDL